MSKHNESTLKEAIEQLLKAYNLDSKLAEHKLIISWEHVMGTMISKHTKDIYIRNRQLFVTLDSAALKHELTLAKNKILIMLNEEAGKEVITDLILR